MENSTALINTVNELLKHGYRVQLLTSDFAALVKPTEHLIKLTTVSADGKVNTLPMSEFLETILNG